MSEPTLGMKLSRKVMSPQMMANSTRKKNRTVPDATPTVRLIRVLTPRNFLRLVSMWRSMTGIMLLALSVFRVEKVFTTFLVRWYFSTRKREAKSMMRSRNEMLEAMVVAALTTIFPIRSFFISSKRL